jgi:hypothetical protein
VSRDPFAIEGDRSFDEADNAARLTEGSTTT